MKSKTVSLLALIGMLFVFIVGRFPLALATSLDSNSTVSSFGSSASVTPVAERVNSATTTVNPTTSKVEPLQVAATPADSNAPTLPWTYILAGIGLAAIILVGFGLRRKRHRFSRFHHLGSIVIMGLLIMSTPYVYGEEQLTVSVWNLSGTGIADAVIMRESVDSAGNVWFAGANNRIGFLNPATNEVKIWVTPELYGTIITVTVDNADKVWFVDQYNQRIGRFDPSTNFFTLWPVDGLLQSWPFTLVSVDSQGNAYFPETANNKIGRLNVATNELTEWVIPTSDSMPCFVMVDASANVWFAEFLGLKIGRLNPSANEITEWPIPNPRSPSGLYVAGGLVYFAEGGTAGLKMGRLDPSTNEMTKWSTSSLGGYDLYGLFVDSSGNAWSVGRWGYVLRLNTSNVFTYWQYYTGTYGIAIDTRVNTGDIYVADSIRVIRFRSATP